MEMLEIPTEDLLKAQEENGEKKIIIEKKPLLIAQSLF